MKAMILAAGLGTRLRPLTEQRPKALVQLEDRTLLQITLGRLRSFGVSEVIVNVHHFADMLVDYLQQHANFGMHIEISREEELLDTGGGLKKAAPFFLRDGSDDPFIVHNVDVLSTIDLAEMVGRHRELGALATLAIQRRDSSRQLLFDHAGQLCGRRNGRDVPVEWARNAAPVEELAFCGVHVLSPKILTQMDDAPAFSIVPTYLRLASAGEKIIAYRIDGAYWRDLGTPASLQQASDDLKRGVVS